jgi:hypothetical protein
VLASLGCVVTTKSTGSKSERTTLQPKPQNRKRNDQQPQMVKRPSPRDTARFPMLESRRSKVSTERGVKRYASPPLAPADCADPPTTPPSTLLTALPANNPWRTHLEALLSRLHTGLEVMRTNIAQVIPSHDQPLSMIMHPSLPCTLTKLTSPLHSHDITRGWV